MSDTKEARRRALEEGLDEVFTRFAKIVARSKEPSTLQKTIRAKRKVFLPHARLSVQFFQEVELTFTGAVFTPRCRDCAPVRQTANIELSHHEYEVDISSLDEAVYSRKLEFVGILVPSTEKNTYPDCASTSNAHLKISFVQHKPSYFDDDLEYENYRLHDEFSD